ncbi:MAG: RagB/SusD family nutrient uptake outer membrane protein [Tannerella sp.]|jgi:hypothetical protein|nr:RagB/SusD family nutrient uptake outer membrane protein [Tannerella sp.]
MNTRKKYQILKIVAAGLLFIGVAGCEDVLDKKNLDVIVMQDVWKDPNLVKNFLNKLYTDVVPDYHIRIEQSTDESFNLYRMDYIQGALNTDNSSDIVDVWNYEKIRNINTLLENIDACPGLSEADRNSFVAQAKILRAWAYWEMVRIYGGVPLILKVQSTADDLEVPRNKTSECVKAIVQDLDDAINTASLPMRWSGADVGRAGKGAALAIKGRVLMTYASPMFLSNHASDASRWQQAYDANKTARDQMASDFGLLQPNGTAFQDYVDVFQRLFTEEQNREVVFSKRWNYPENSTGVQGRSWYLRPQTSKGGFGVLVTLETANTFLKADGSAYTGLPLNPGPTTTPFWLDREPRFYASVVYNGAKWDLPRDGGKVTDKEWIFYGAATPYDSDDSYGILVRKGIQEGGTYDDVNKISIDWNEIRFAEVLLNFAECAAQTGHPDEAIQVLKEIRQRAGIPAGANGNYGLASGLSGESLVKEILTERLREFSYENKRFWDLRRYRLYTDGFSDGSNKLNGKKLHGIRHDLKTPFNAATPEQLDAIDIQTPEGIATYFGLFDDQIRELNNMPEISVPENHYFLRIIREHRITNPNLEQTTGWDNGTFNPYE